MQDFSWIYREKFIEIGKQVIGIADCWRTQIVSALTQLTQFTDDVSKP